MFLILLFRYHVHVYADPTEGDILSGECTDIISRRTQYKKNMKEGKGSYLGVETGTVREGESGQGKGVGCVSWHHYSRFDVTYEWNVFIAWRYVISLAQVSERERERERVEEGVCYCPVVLYSETLSYASDLFYPSLHSIKLSCFVFSELDYSAST